MWVFPLVAAFISAFFSGIVTNKYMARRHPAHLAWALALFIFAVATACDFLGSFSGWTSFIAKMYYLAGATVVVGYLGLGTLYLLCPRPVAHVWLAIMLVATLLAVVLLAGAGVDAAALKSETEPGWKAIEKSALLTGLAVAINSLGTLILVVGAVYSAVYRRYPLANILIAAGTLIVAAGGGLTRLGHYEFQSIGQAAGIIIMFIGFLMTITAASGKRSSGKR